MIGKEQLVSLDTRIILEINSRNTIFAIRMKAGSLVDAWPPIVAVIFPQLPLRTYSFCLGYLRRIWGPKHIGISLSFENLHRQTF